ncbi:MAG: chloride channel protein [Candidatus Ornithomonoglobus sp.]
MNIKTLIDKFRTGKIREMVICSLLAILIGAQLGFISGFFGRALEFIEEFRAEHYIVLVPFLGFAGVVIIFLYKHFSPNSEQGLNLAIAYNMGEVSDNGEIKDFGHAQKLGRYPDGYVLLKLISNAIMLLFGASTGKEGTVATCGAAIGDYMSRIFRARKYSRILLVTGVSAAVAGLFQTPLGGLFFALEFSAVGVLFYQALIPALIGAYTAYYISKVCGLAAFSHAVSYTVAITPKVAFLIVVCSIVFGIAGRLFAVTLHKAHKLYDSKVKNRYIGIFIGGSIMAVLLIFVSHGRYCGTGSSMLSELLMTHTTHYYDFIIKFVFTIACIIIGFSGGEMMPIMAIGASLGAVMAQLTGLPFELTVVMGCTAVYSSATNTLLAPMFIGIEMFGISSTIYIAVACIIAFAINGNKSVYTKQGHVPRYMYSTLRK